MTKMTLFIASWVCALLLIVACLPFTVAGQKSRFDPDGTFWIHGEVPDGFSDFGGINLNSKRVRHLPKAGLELNNGKTFRFKTLSVRRERFAFTTVVLSKVSYSFLGKFLRGGVYGAGDLDDETPVLEGVLTKMVNGKKVAEANLKFVYFGGT